MFIMYVNPVIHRMSGILMLGPLQKMYIVYVEDGMKKNFENTLINL